MTLRTRLIGAMLFVAAITSIGEQLWATTCAPGMPMSGSDHSTMPGMPDMAGALDETGQPASSQPAGKQAGDCPLDDALVQACSMSMLIPTATVVPPGAPDHVIGNIGHTLLTPHTNHLTSVFHPPKL